MTSQPIDTPEGTVIPTHMIYGTVISVSTRTEFTTVRDRDTHLGNGKMLPGQVYNEASTVDDVWLKTDDGKEMKLPFQPLGLAMRDGHSVAFIVSKNDKGEAKCLGAKNFTTGEIQTSTANAKHMASQAVSKPPKLPMGPAVQVPTMLAISFFAAIAEGRGFGVGYFIASIFFCLMGMAFLSVLRHSSRSDRVAAEAKEILLTRLNTLQAP